MRPLGYHSRNVNPVANHGKGIEGFIGLRQGGIHRLHPFIDLLGRLQCIPLLLATSGMSTCTRGRSPVWKLQFFRELALPHGLVDIVLFELLRWERLEDDRLIEIEGIELSNVNPESHEVIHLEDPLAEGAQVVQDVGDLGTELHPQLLVVDGGPGHGWRIGDRVKSGMVWTVVNQLGNESCLEQDENRDGEEEEGERWLYAL